LDLITLANKIINAATQIDAGRKGFATRGKAEEGRISYEEGIAAALSAFQEAQITTGPHTIILAEYTFLTQELEFCKKTNKDSLTSLTKAIQFFDDTFFSCDIYNINYSYDTKRNFKFYSGNNGFNLAYRIDENKIYSGSYGYDFAYRIDWNKFYSVIYGYNIFFRIER